MNTTYIYDNNSLNFFRTINVSDKSCTENQNALVMSSNFLRKSYRLWDNVEKYVTVGQVTWQHDTAHALFMMDD